MLKNQTTLGTVDIGTNAVRLLIEYAEIYPDTTEFNRAVYIRVPIRLGEDVFTIGKVGQEKKRLLSEAMQGFSHLLRAYGVDSFRACATSAMREAKNGKEIIKCLKKLSGIKVDIITGQEEARLVFKAGEFDSFVDKDKNYVYMDVGGGSTEIIVYSNHRMVSARSFRLGTVRILSDAVEGDEPARFAEHLGAIAREYRPVALIGSGGNINKAYKLLKKKSGEVVPLEELDALYARLESLSFDERMETFHLNSYRADVIVPAVSLFSTAAHTCGVERIIVPKVGLCDGIIHDIYDRSLGDEAGAPL